MRSLVQGSEPHHSPACASAQGTPAPQTDKEPALTPIPMAIAVPGFQRAEPIGPHGANGRLRVLPSFMFCPLSSRLRAATHANMQPAQATPCCHPTRQLLASAGRDSDVLADMGIARRQLVLAAKVTSRVKKTRHPISRFDRRQAIPEPSRPRFPALAYRLLAGYKPDTRWILLNRPWRFAAPSIGPNDAGHGAASTG